MSMRLFSAISRAWRRTSLRSQLVTITSGLLLLTLVVTTFVSASLYRQELLRSVDEDLRSNAQALAYYFEDIRSDEFEDAEGPRPTWAEFQSIFRFYGWMLDDEGAPIPGLSLRTSNSESLDVPQIPQVTPEEAAELGPESFNVPGTLENSRGFRVQAHP